MDKKSSIRVAVSQADQGGIPFFEETQFGVEDALHFVQLTSRALEGRQPRHVVDVDGIRISRELPSIIMIENWTAEFREMLLEVFPAFPTRALEALEEVGVQAQSTLPSYDRSVEGFQFIIDHLGLYDEELYEHLPRRLLLCDQACIRVPISSYSFRRAGGSDIVIFISNAMTPEFIFKLTSHYLEDDQKRWARLALSTLWVAPDLLFLFTNWNSVLEAMLKQLHSAEKSGRESNLPIEIQTRLLHEQMATAIELSEILRIHQAIGERVISFLSTKLEQVGTSELAGRLDHIKEQMTYNVTTINTIKEQLQNLIQLAFNLEAVSQGQSVARLSVLAFIFIPLSYVATMFAIPTITVEPKWYPAAAIPLLFITILIASLSGKMVKFWENKSSIAYRRAPNESVTLGNFFTRSGTKEASDDLEKGPNEIETVQKSTLGSPGVPLARNLGFGRVEPDIASQPGVPPLSPPPTPEFLDANSALPIQQYPQETYKPHRLEEIEEQREESTDSDDSSEPYKSFTSSSTENRDRRSSTDEKFERVRINRKPDSEDEDEDSYSEDDKEVLRIIRAVRRSRRGRSKAKRKNVLRSHSSSIRQERRDYYSEGKKATKRKGTKRRSLSRSPNGNSRRERLSPLYEEIHRRPTGEDSREIEIEEVYREVYDSDDTWNDRRRRRSLPAGRPVIYNEYERRSLSPRERTAPLTARSPPLVPQENRPRQRARPPGSGYGASAGSWGHREATTIEEEIRYPPRPTADPSRFRGPATSSATWSARNGPGVVGEKGPRILKHGISPPYFNARSNAGVASAGQNTPKKPAKPPSPVTLLSRSNAGVASGLRDPERSRRTTVRGVEIIRDVVSGASGGGAPSGAEMQAMRERVSYLETLVEANRQRPVVVPPSARQEGARSVSPEKERRGKKRRIWF